MRATLTPRMPAAPGGPIQGTFYPDAVGAGSGGAMLPRILAILGAIVFVRMLVAGRHRQEAGKAAGGPGGGRRREALARLHRELHAHDEGRQPDREVMA